MSDSTNSYSTGDKYFTILSMVVAKAWKDAGYRASLLQNPAAAIKEEGLSFPPDVTFKVLENTATVRYLPLSRSLDLDNDINQIKFLFSHLFPLPAGDEIRLVQSTDTIRYIVIPMLPKNVSAETTSEMELSLYAKADGVTVTVTDVATVQTVATVSTEVTGAEAAVEVVAVAVAVLT